MKKIISFLLLFFLILFPCSFAFADDDNKPPGAPPGLWEENADGTIGPRGDKDVRIGPGAGAGKIATSDAVGNVSWETAPAGTVPNSGTDTNARLVGDGAGGWDVATGIFSIAAYGVRWDSNADTYTMGVVANGVGSFISSTYTDFPIQAQMRRCILSDGGVVQYYLESDDSYNRMDVSPSITGTDDTGTASKVSDSGVFAAAESTYLGKYVHNTTDDTYALITAKDSNDVLSISADIMDSAETFEICTAAIGYGGSDGQVMVEIPQFHYIQCQYGDYRYFIISSSAFSMTLPDSSIEYSTIHPAFYKGGSATPSDYRYIGAYEGSMYDATASAMVVPADIVTSMYASGDKMCSLSGEYPKTNETIIECRAMAEARGAGWHQFDSALQSALATLYLTEFADFSSQTKIGNGRSALTNGDWVASEIHDGTNYGYIGKCGLSDSDGNAINADNSATDLETAESPAYMSYRGIENWYGNVWKFLDGVNIHNSTANGSRLYFCGDHTAYASDTDTGYTMSGLLAEADGYPIDIIDTTGIWSSAIGGSSSTYLCDYYYTYFDNDPDSGWRVARVGGYAPYGTSAGAFCVHSYSASSTATSTVGGRLCF